jgi:hypothetical protein
LLSGFGSALSTLKKESPKLFTKSTILNEKYSNTGLKLAVRALGWGTLYSITSCSMLFYSIWQISGAISFKDFHQKIRKYIRPISKNNASL